MQARATACTDGMGENDLRLCAWHWAQSSNVNVIMRHTKEQRHWQRPQPQHPFLFYLFGGSAPPQPQRDDSRLVKASRLVSASERAAM